MRHIQNLRLANAQANRIEAIDAIQGAVLVDGFKVTSLVSEHNKKFHIRVYDNEERTSMVFKSSDEISDEFNSVRFKVTGLNENTQYYWDIYHKGNKTKINGKIKTLPTGNASFKFVSGSCAVGPQIPGENYRYSNHEVFRNIKKWWGDEIVFLWHLGDIHYQDVKSLSAKDYFEAHNGVLRQYNQQDLYLNTSLFSMWDDHDFTGNDSNGAKNPEWTEPAIYAYRKRFPMYDTPFNGVLEPICHKVSVGRVLMINLDCRSQKEKHQGTILGSAQKQWLKDTMLAATEKAFIINVGVPWISPSGGDMWGSVAVERQEIMDFFINNGFADKTILIAGDAHSVAIDDGTNNQGIPVFQCSAFDSPPTIKGGPYSEGVSDFRYQYMVFDVQDKGDTIEITGSGYRVVGGLYKPLPQTYTHIIDTTGGLYDPDFQAWIDYNILQGHYITSDTVKLDAANQYVINSKADGTWQGKDVELIFAWNDLQMADASLVCMKRLVKATVYGGMTYTVNGWKGNGVDGYIDTLFNPFIDGVNYTLNDASRTYLPYGSWGNYARVLGHPTSAQNWAWTGVGNSSQRINNTLNSTPNYDTTGNGLKSISRLNETDTEFTNKDVFTTHTNSLNTGNTMPNENYILFNSYANNFLGDGVLSLFELGGYLTQLEVQNVRTNLNTYLTLIGLTPYA